MNAEYFLDTNLLVYAFDQSAGAKRLKALELIHVDAPWIISSQVIQEFCSVALHRFKIPMDPASLSDYVGLILRPHCRVVSSVDLLGKALQVHAQTQYRFYDSLIVAAALESGVPILYSEDLQHGRQIDRLRIINPFLE